MMMKAKKKIFIGVTILALIVLVTLVTWITPKTFLAGVESKTIQSISVRDGSSGKNYTITNPEDISEIVKKIQSQSFKKSGFSIFHMGTLYSLSFYDFDGKVVEEFVVNADDTFRKDPFFYSTMPELIKLTEIIKNANSELKEETKVLTIDDVIALSRKGDAITFADLRPFKHSENIGSGLYIVIYDIDQSYYLIVGGTSTELSDNPVYVRLAHKEDHDTFIDNDEWIDIRMDDVKKFLEE